VLALALALALTQTPQHRLRMQPNLPRSIPKSIENAIQAGDKVGNWWALKADGTMVSGSATTLSPQSSPGTSPLTFNGSSQYFASVNVAYPVGDFSVVGSFNFPSNPGANSYIAAKWDTANLAWVVFIDTAGKLNLAVQDSGASTNVLTALTASSTGTWLAVCATFTSGTKAMKVRAVGVNATTTSTNSGVAVLSFPHSVGAGGAGGGKLTGSSRGVFFTETPLSDAACDRIMAGAI
jgi:hypothetical protein